MPDVRYQEPYAPSTRGDHWGTLNAARRALGLGPHRGMDWAPGDVPALAIADGTVAGKWALRDSRVLGNVLVLRHEDGMFSGTCHLESLPSLKIGAEVERHHSIGANLGSTGSAASGRHMHLALGRSLRSVFEGVTVDPLAWILAHDDAPAEVGAKHDRRSTTARLGEGLSAIAARAGISFARITKANPKIAGPKYPVALGQRVWLE